MSPLTSRHTYIHCCRCCVSTVRCLLVLDNFEHLLASTDLVADMVQQAPRVSILVTSRARLNLQTEWLFDVDGLAYPSAESHTSAPAAIR